MTTLPVSEVFGPTFQGEGPHAGRRCAFVRLGLCNLTCEWCDTPFTWDRSRYDLAVENPDTELDTIHERIQATGCSLVVLSGGEPMIHQRHFPELMSDALWVTWHIETNGTLTPNKATLGLIQDGTIQHVTVSPKINTRDPERRRLRVPALIEWAGVAQERAACFKFVVTDPAVDLPFIDALVDELLVPHDAVWLMPEGTSADAVQTHHKQLAAALLAHDRGYSTTTRLHTLLWGDERGH